MGKTLFKEFEKELEEGGFVQRQGVFGSRFPPGLFNMGP